MFIDTAESHDRAPEEHNVFGDDISGPDYVPLLWSGNNLQRLRTIDITSLRDDGSV
jgi:hypothetical protein